MNYLKLLAILVFFFSEIALSSGKITLRGDSFDENADEYGQSKYSLGLNVYQQLMPENELVFIGFYGANLDGDWFKADQAVQYTHANVVYGAGVQAIMRGHGNNPPNTFYATLGYKLWN